MSTVYYTYEGGQVYEFVDRQTHNRALAELDAARTKIAALETLLAEWQEDYALEHKRARKWRRKYAKKCEWAAAWKQIAKIYRTAYDLECQGAQEYHDYWRAARKRARKWKRKYKALRPVTLEMKPENLEAIQAAITRLMLDTGCSKWEAYKRLGGAVIVPDVTAEELHDWFSVQGAGMEW